MSDLHAYEFPSRPASGVLLGLSAARLGTIATAGVVLIVVMTSPTPTSLLTGAATIVGLLASVAIKIAGRAVVDWLPVWVAYGWAMATRNNEFYSSPDLTAPLPDGTLDLPGELFGIEVHHLAVDTPARGTSGGYGVVRDTRRQRLIAVVEVSGADFLFLDPADQQARVSAWGGVLDHVAQSMPELVRIQVIHSVGPASTRPLDVHHRQTSGLGTDATDASYRQAAATAQQISQQHRLLVAIALDLRTARRAIRQAGGGTDGAAQVLMDRAARVEDALHGAGLEVHGWLGARAIGQVLRNAFDPARSRPGTDLPRDGEGDGVDPVAAAPTAMVDGWSAVRHDSGWSTTLQVVRPPARPVNGDFLQHLLIGVPATRRLSLLYVPVPSATAERRAQTQQVSTESEQTLRARWGFSTTARQRKAHADAARREADLAEGHAVFQVVWLITVTAPSPTELDAAVGQVESAARRCGLELRRLAGTQRQALGFTLPLCRGAR